MSLAVPLRRVRALYALSRGTQALLSVAQPAVAILLADADPPPGRLLAAVVAVCAGLFSGFAINDLLDAPLDRRRRAAGAGVEAEAQGWDVDAPGLHPLVRGEVSHRLAVTWVVSLGALAVALSALLSWVCVALFLGCVLLQAAYCALARVTAYKAVLSGAMVGAGACTGWFAFTGEVDPLLLGALALWGAAWEVGGRNIPNDLADAEEDARLGITTVPTVYGPARAAAVAFVTLAVAAVACTALAVAAWPAFGLTGVVGTAASAAVLLLAPAARLLRAPTPANALALFNRASFQPPCVLAVCVLTLLVPSLP